MFRNGRGTLPSTLVVEIKVDSNMSTAANAALPLEVAGARKKFGDVEALAGASFDVRPGELLGLLGPNGAGKTTVIKAIAGRLHLDAGTIRVFGRTVTPRDSRPDVGLVPQELAVYPLLTARENLEVFGTLYGVSKSELQRRVSWALEWSDLKDRSGEPVKRFSGGMKRRLNIACSLLHDPKLVLLDEPTVGVDPQSRERIYEMLSALRQAGVSIVLTTHHLEEAEQRCDRIVIIDKGRIVASGTLASCHRFSRSALARRAGRVDLRLDTRPGPRRSRHRRRAGSCQRRSRRPTDHRGRQSHAARCVHRPYGPGAARMIGTFLRIGLINLRRDRVAQALTFLLPIMFFSIFASVFGNQRNATSASTCRSLIEDQIGILEEAGEGARRRGRPAGDDHEDRAAVERGGVRSTGADSATSGLVKAGRASRSPSDRSAKGILGRQSLFQRDASKPEDPGARGRLGSYRATDGDGTPSEGQFHRGAGRDGDRGDRHVREIRRASHARAENLRWQSGSSGSRQDRRRCVGEHRRRLGRADRDGQRDAARGRWQADGVVLRRGNWCDVPAVLGHRGQRHTARRSRQRHPGPPHWIARRHDRRAGGKWLFTALTGMAQLTVMFIWGAVVFGLPLMSHLPGFAVMTVFTAAAAAGFGLLLATVSKTRAQLSGLSTIIILAMSAVGGSMFPRFLMSEGMQKMGLATFNAWALDGYIKVFWREAPIIDLWPQLLVLTILCGVFLTGARLAARRWETL